jgi:hypothetical protein
MVTLADLRARNTLPTWQEAVAVVQELANATLAAKGSGARLPDIEHLSLNVDGTVALLPGSVVPGHPVRHIANVLHLLLDGVGAPDQLIELAQRNRVSDPPCATLQEFSAALAFFERPGRAEDIARLVARAAAAEEQTRADEELKLLKARALDTEPKEEPKPTVRRRHVPRWAIAALAVCVVAALGALAWRSVLTTVQESTQAPPIPSAPGGEPPSAGDSEPAGGPSTPPAAQAESKPAPSFIDRVAHAVRSAAASLTRSSSDDARPAVATEPVTEPARVRPRKRTTPPAAETPKPSKIDDAAVTIRITELGGYPLQPPTSSVAAVATASPDDGLTYSAEDDEVLPPVIMRPVIPGPPDADAPADSFAIFDLVVDPQGNVEQVKTVSVPSRYRDRMILAHLKAWGFKPATRDGHPVRYRVRIRLLL